MNPTYTDTGSANLSYSTHSTPRGSISNIDNLEERVTIYTVPQGKLWKLNIHPEQEVQLLTEYILTNLRLKLITLTWLLIAPSWAFDKTNNQSTERFNQIQFPLFMMVLLIQKNF